MQKLSYLLALVWFVPVTSPATTLTGKAPADAFARKVQPFLKLHCIACHGPDRQKGGVRLDGPEPDLSDAKSAARWLAVKRMVSQGQMPPEGSAQPKADDVIAVLSWLDDAAARAAVVTRGGVGRRALRRLTNREYVNTLHDLLGLTFPHAVADLAGRLPKDDAPHSFSAEFRKLLADGAPEKDRFTEAFSRRLFSYVLGRGLDPGDEAHLNAVRGVVSRGKGGLRTLLTAVVQAEPFRNK